MLENNSENMKILAKYSAVNEVRQLSRSAYKSANQVKNDIEEMKTVLYRVEELSDEDKATLYESLESLDKLQKVLSNVEDNMNKKRSKLGYKLEAIIDKLE